MQAELQELVTLLEIQKIDLEIMQAKKKRVELPQRIAVMRLRKKRGEIQAKLDQVLELQKNSTPYIFLVGFRYQQPTGSSLFQSAAQSLMVGAATAEETCQLVQDGIATYYAPFQK